MVKGYIYVLANSSMPDMVKIGRTSGSPQDRAQQLSSTTGVPTPFLVVYEEYFDDSVSAELHIHTLLQHRGYRISENREFFCAPIPEVIRVIHELVLRPERQVSLADVQEEVAPEEFEMPRTGCFAPSYFVDDNADSVEPWADIWNEAEGSYYGLGDYFQDPVHARKLYLKSLKLGCIYAYEKLGRIYNDGEGVKEDKVQALEYFREGAKKGDYLCYLAVADMFIDTRQYENVNKCIRLFLRSRSQSIDSELEPKIGAALENIARSHSYGRLPLSEDCILEIVQNRGSLVVPLQESVDYWGEGDPLAVRDSRLIFWLENLA